MVVMIRTMMMMMMMMTVIRLGHFATIQPVVAKDRLTFPVVAKSRSNDKSNSNNNDNKINGK